MRGIYCEYKHFSCSVPIALHDAKITLIAWVYHFGSFQLRISEALECKPLSSILPMDDCKNDPTNLIITIFHKEKLDRSYSNGVDPQTSSSDNSFILDIAELFTKLPVPNQPVQSAQLPALSVEGVTRYTLTVHQPPEIDCSTLRHSSLITNFEAKHGVEIIFDLSKVTPSGQRPIKLALFDMDSTLINEEVIDELARSIGISDAVSAITARAMNGDIDFATSLKQRVAMLKGVPLTVWEDLKKTVTIAEGARELIAGLKKRGVYTGVVSGGFTPMAEWLKEQLGLDVAVANHLLESSPTDEFPYSHLSGQLNPNIAIVTPELKRKTLLELCASKSVPLSETMAVGDGSNDLLMLGIAGLGIAWRAKEKVQIAAPMRLNGKSLEDLLYLLGPDTK